MARVDTPGCWGDRDVFQLRPREYFVDNGLVGATVVAVNALSETSAAYLAPVKVLEMHRDGYPLCENREVDGQNPPPVLLPNRAALAEWCSYAAEYRGDAYERTWERDGGESRRSGRGASFLLGNKRKMLHCDYFCTYLDELGVGVAFEPCAYDGKFYYTGYYTYGLAVVLQQWKNDSGCAHLIVHRGDECAIDDVVELMYRWYDGGESSIVNASIWHKS